MFMLFSSGQLSRQGGVGDEPSSGGLSHVDEVVAALRELVRPPVHADSCS